MIIFSILYFFTPSPKPQYCPCRPISGNQEEDKQKICPCKWHKDEIAADGHCHCQLFFSKNG
ncbi:MAG: hypothetical protein HY920_01100 [Elusimicrobia bacterium]|nr:hypothetical protein [Elusimicrobiota bacterium]